MKNNNKIIPLALGATIILALGFFMMPVEQASTIHNTSLITSSSMGLACTTETVTMTTATNVVDNDVITFTFNKSIDIYRMILSSDDLAGDTIGFDVFTIDGILPSQWNSIDEDIDDTPDDLLADLFIRTSIMMDAGEELAFTIDDDFDGLTVDDTDELTFQFCGLVSDPANFVGADIDSAVTEA